MQPNGPDKLGMFASIAATNSLTIVPVNFPLTLETEFGCSL